MSDIKLNDRHVDFESMDISYLEKEKWDDKYLSAVRNAPVVTKETFDATTFSEVRINYDSLDDEFSPTSFVTIAHWAGVMDNIKAGVPRTAYKGIVTCYKNNKKLHIAPAKFL